MVCRDLIRQFINRKQFMHTSDMLLPPKKNCPTDIQFATVCRLMDIEYFMKSNDIGSIYFQGLLHHNASRREAEDFAEFIRFLDSYGYDPRISVLPMRAYPILEMADGTHRLGYILSKVKNAIVPVRLLKSPSEREPSEARKTMYEQGMDERDISRVFERYFGLLDEIKRDVVGFVSEEFIKDRPEIIEKNKHLGEILDISEIEIDSDKVFQFIKTKCNCKKITRNLFMVRIRLEHQKLLLSGNRFYSEDMRKINDYIRIWGGWIYM